MIKTLFFFYCLILVVIITAGAGFNLLLLPLIIFFLATLLAKIPAIGRLQLPYKGFLAAALLAYCFIVVTIITVSGLIGAKNIAQLISGALFIPLAWYFAWQVLPKRKQARHIPFVVMTPREVEQPKRAVETKKSAPQKLAPIDVDRRQFLRLIGSAGLSLFLFSIFAKKAQAAFFGSVPGPGTVSIKDSTGTVIDPAISTPTDGYKITQIDDSTPAYFGFVRKDGAWFIMQENTGAYRYAKGADSFSTNWTNRTLLTYDYFDNVF